MTWRGVHFGDHLQSGSGLLLLGQLGGAARCVGENARHRLFVGLGRLLVGVAGRATGDRHRVGGPRRLAVRLLGSHLVTEVSVGEPVPDDLEGQKVLTLLAQDPAQALHVVIEELAVPRRRTLGIDQTLALEEPDLRDGDVRELLPEEGQHVADGEIGTAGHSLPATR